ncbi:MAG: tetratricopeptide repeat protein [Phycisphaerae bacterium]|nr:tetratricopeptide repeat protein [Phycisphaerae bacterium]MDD5380733.1 tetratricopeptide repeat protein [Phycisphaerae bacterium]
MSKKSHSIALAFIILLVSVAVAKVPVDASDRLEQAKSNIVSLVNGGNYTQAQAQIQKLLAGFPKNQALPQALYEIAERYRWSDKSDKYECAKGLYQQIIQNYPDSSIVSKANLGIAKVKVLSLIVARDFNMAKEALEELVANFSSHPDLPEELYWIGRGFGYWDGYEEEKSTYQQIIQNYPDSPFAVKAKLGVSRAAVQSLIVSQDYDGAEKAFAKLVADFKDHPDLHDTIYWIADRYARSGKYEKANILYQWIIQNYPDNSSAVDRAKLGLSMANIQSLIMSGGYDSAEEAIDRLIVDFAGHPDVANVVRNIGLSYYAKARLMNLEGDANGEKLFYRKAIEVWERLIFEFPDSEVVPNAYFSSAVCYAQELGEYQKGIDYFQKIINNWPDFEDAQQAQLLIVEYRIKMENSKNEK